MSYVKSEDPLEDLPEQGGDPGRNQSCPGMDFDLRDELVEHEEDDKGQGDRDEILDEEIIDESDKIIIDILGDEAVCLDGPLDAGPDKGDEEGDEHDDPDGEHDQIFHEAVVEEGFLVVGLEDEVYGINQVGEKKAGCDKGAGQTEPAQIGDAARELPDSLEEVGIELGEEFLGEDIQALQGRFRVAHDPGGNEGEESDQGNSAEQGEVGDGDGEVAASVLVEPFERITKDLEERRFHLSCPVY